MWNEGLSYDDGIYKLMVPVMTTRVRPPTQISSPAVWMRTRPVP